MPTPAVSTRPPRRTLALALAFCALALGAATGCAGADPGAAGPSAHAAPALPDRVEPLSPAPVPALPATVPSADGRTVTVASADRIVPLSGSLNELVQTLGLGPQVVARDITATFEQAARLPVVTRGHEVSAESVLSLRPTLVLAETASGPAEALAQIRDAGVPLLVVAPARSLDDVPRRIDTVAGALGVKEAGTRLKERTDGRIAAARTGIPASAAAGRKPRVAFLYLRGTASVYLMGGSESGAAPLLEAAGAVDTGKESGLGKDFTPITSEALAAAAPDAILVMSKGLESVGGTEGLVKIPGVAQTPAGMDRRVIAVDDGVLLSYGPRTDQVLSSLITQLYGKAA
ncbi:ABC transporter substrate-binding protein [Streptomyces sp. NPDC032472]|uniref:heme/hemin ABC transporter substrate-binding protein n=1 Tax=Streptomyces sp. NPDC032472 TaxID=3155018 RepID=UPI0033D70BCD